MSFTGVKKKLLKIFSIRVLEFYLAVYNSSWACNMSEEED